MKHIIKFFLIFLIGTLLGSVAFASDLRVRGQVKGLISDDRKAVPVVLSKVSVAVSLEGSVIVEKTNLAGVYMVDLKRDRRYLMTVSRPGYNSKSVWISTQNLPRLKNNVHVELTDLDFLLLKKDAFPDDISEKEDMGQIAFDPNKKEFKLNINKDFRQDKSNKDNSIQLMRRTITYLRNEESIDEKKDISLVSEKVNEIEEESGPTLLKEARGIIPAIEEQKVDANTLGDSSRQISLEEIQSRRQVLDSARKRLSIMWERARTSEDSLMIQRLEAEIRAAEMDLAYAEQTIFNQQNEIALQKKLIGFYVISILLLLAIAGVIFYFYREKNRINKELEHKNQVILDGISYANTIQRSFLKSEAEIQKVLPEFVLVFRPRDIVSGDIYWVSKVDSKSVVAAIDCTGHGVPGAFISMIANTLLNEIVNNKKILEPGKILEGLHKGVIDALQQKDGDSQSQDGMDMSLIVIDDNLKKIHFAGAKNHMYRVKGDDLEVVRADINSIGGRSMRTRDGFEKTFTTKEVLYDTESVYYLFSDGFMDQFGGEEENKFNLPNFMDLLKRCASMSVEEQRDELHATFDDWKGDLEQLDDMLVFGVRLKSS